MCTVRVCVCKRGKGETERELVRATKVKKGYGVGGEEDRYGTSYMSEQKISVFCVGIIGRSITTHLNHCT